jgi:hypothetical protein
MQSLSASISDLLYLAHLCNLEFDHYPMKLSDNVILRREPKNLEILRCAQDDNSGGLVGYKTAFPFLCREKEMQNQRHEVCLKYIGSKSGASGEPSPRFKWDGWEPRPWKGGILEGWNNGENSLEEGDLKWFLILLN